ncbi:hypothetical protein LCGC14_2492010 [marine sediment metagenome]|uniref:Holin n=1 Tax=marine sediment metagenome TaxID=412755 RepID=A0A0F9BSF2_9ZZZZ
MSYEFKIAQEVAWAFAIGALTAFIQIAVTFDPATITEWGVWAAASGAAVLRAGAAMTLPVLLRVGKKILGK